MYIVSLHYTATLERIDDALPAHRNWLDAQFEGGNFIAAGPKMPRDGGVILASHMPRERLDALLATDPFAQQGLAGYDITEFKATRLASGLNLPRPETP
ncbi:MAG TPA: YciI family protein [Paraburkholderia sp.]|uniref:YciI family protein n=1 Tax=Paraburkholderia sp. TaxID=1926495 RepID=UPI002B829673|nr:YciI family protein [Paraburkholderia sp.]HTR09760.1 YciI family protein [Paraburkholderia sp.]